MERIITVRGIGRASVKPDNVTLTFTLEAKDMDYQQAADTAAGQIEALRQAVEAAGHSREDLKTVDLGVRTEYRGVDENGRYRQEFDGYVCSHTLRLDFDLTPERLSETLTALSRCAAKPSLSVGFSVKDPTAVSEAILRDAAANARRRAALLCEASGTALGELLRIDYDWNRPRFESRSRFEENMARPMLAKAAFADLAPQEIEAEDSASFTWAIE